MSNADAAKLLLEMANLLELSDDNPFRIRAFRRAAEAVANFPTDVQTLDRAQQLDIPGIGKGISDILQELARTGRVKEHQKLKSKFPEGVLDMLTVSGLGPKRAALLYKKLKIDSVAKLMRAAKDKKLEKLEGFGTKIQENILKGAQRGLDAPNRWLVAHAHAKAAQVMTLLASSPVIEKLTLAGSARRWKETVGDLDFLCVSSAPVKAIDAFLKYSSPVRILGAGKTKASVILDNGFQCDFRVVPEKSFGAALLYFTGSKEHNVRLREIAQKKNMTLNEYGLFKNADKKQEKPVASRSEEDVYRALGMAWIPPELREDRGEIEAAINDTLPDLVTERDVLGDFHNHTHLSDGRDTLEEMVAAAQAKGWRWFFSADHSPSLKIASGLPVEVLRKKMAKIKALPKSPIAVYCSSEVDILGDGQMDYPEAILKELDCVVASVHTLFKQPEDEMTRRICRAMENPHVDIVAHLTGRLINRRLGYAVDIEKIFETAVRTQTALEINGQPDRAELNDVQVRRAISLGVPLVVDTDGHSTQELNHMTLAVHIARRGWAEPKHILNCRPIEGVLDWFGN